MLYGKLSTVIAIVHSASIVLKMANIFLLSFGNKHFYNVEGMNVQQVTFVKKKYMVWYNL